MRLPWVQVDQSAFARAEELAAVLSISTPEALGHLVMLWRWALDLGPEDEAPSGVAEGRVAVIRLEAGAGWRGDRGALFSALLDLELVEGVEGCLRVRGLDRYEAVVSKRAADRARKAALKARPSVGSPAEVARNSAGSREESGGKTQTQTQTQRTTPPVGPPGGAPFPAAPLPPVADTSALAPGDSLRDAIEAVWLGERGAPYVWGRRDDAATRSLVELSADAGEILRRWRIGLQRRFPAATCVSDLVRHWNAYAAPEQPAGAAPPGRPRATDGAGAPQPSRPCGVCGEPVERGDTWGQWLCAPDAAACIDAMASEPSSAAAARWVQSERGGSR